MILFVIMQALVVICVYYSDEWRDYLLLHKGLESVVMILGFIGMPIYVIGLAASTANFVSKKGLNIKEWPIYDIILLFPVSIALLFDLWLVFMSLRYGIVDF